MATQNYQTYVGLGILGYGLWRLVQQQPEQEITPAAAPGGIWSTEDGVSTGNSLAYWADATQTVWSGKDIYGIPAQDIKSPDGSLRRVWGSQWQQGV
jgi:hypothetical protein